MLPSYDWDHTRAFALPTDQHGWIRVNLVGSEARGTVPGVLYDEVCNELENELQNLRSDRGVSLVDRVIRVARNAEAASLQRLPDLVVHWTDEVFAKPLRIEGSVRSKLNQSERNKSGNTRWKVFAF